MRRIALFPLFLFFASLSLCGAVIDAVKKWKFAPTELDGDPVEVVLRIPYVFNIR